MICVVQRVSSASVSVAAHEADGPHFAKIDRGLLALVAAETSDADSHADWIADKLAALRIFPDDEGKMNRSVTDIGGEILVISQFTLAGDARKGARPSFIRAERPERAAELVERVASRLAASHGVPVGRGVFGAHMDVALVNDGPVTIILRRGPAGGAQDE